MFWNDENCKCIFIFSKIEFIATNVEIRSGQHHPRVSRFRNLARVLFTIQFEVKYVMIDTFRISSQSDVHGCTYI